MAGKGLYRYPGTRPFEDIDSDRKLFFGREREKEELLQKIIARKLVVLHAESGLGKTSLLNAGVSALLRERGYLPIKIRFNLAGISPVQAVFSGIAEAAAQQRLDLEPGETDTLWHYFKTAAFWSPDDSLLTPVLIFDQFEEFFAFHEPAARGEFIRQVADLVHNTLPAALRQAIRAGQPYRYGEEPPRVKMVISIRGDFLGQLDELSFAVPEILDNRFRLLALTRLQAREAITGPAQIADEQIFTPCFRYSEEAVNTMLDYLSRRRERGGVVNKDEVESFQLQLLCRHIETEILEKAGKAGSREEREIKKGDLGGEGGLDKVFQHFYEDRLAGLKSVLQKRRVRRLCEKGLISATDRRLSLEEEVIETQFKVSPALLAQLVDNRLLRAEKRVGSVYYELSHDSLVAPIRLSQRTSMYLLLKEAEQLHSESQIGPAIAKYKKFLKANPQNKGAYETLAVLYLEIGEKEKAFDIYKKAISADVEFAGIYKKIRDVLKQKNDTETLEELYGIALQVKSKDAYHYFKLGFDYYYLKKYDAAIASFKKALELKPNYTSAYNNMGAAQVKKGDYDAAIVSYQKALELKPGYAVAYNNMGIAYRKKGDYDAAIASYQKALEIEPTYRFAKENLSELYLTTERFDKAMELARKLLKEKDVQQGDILAMKSIIISSLFFKGNQARALMELQQFITYYRGLTKEYAREWTYSPTKKFISKTKRLSEPTRALLLKMLDLLETPLKEAEPILLELEKMVKELGK